MLLRGSRTTEAQRLPRLRALPSSRRAGLRAGRRNALRCAGTLPLVARNDKKGITTQSRGGEGKASGSEEPLARRGEGEFNAVLSVEKNWRALQLQ